MQYNFDFSVKVDGYPKIDGLLGTHETHANGATVSNVGYSNNFLKMALGI